MPHNFDKDDRIWLKLEQVISKISLSSTRKSFSMLPKLFGKKYWEKGRISFLGGTPCIYALNLSVCVCVYMVECTLTHDLGLCFS